MAFKAMDAKKPRKTAAHALAAWHSFSLNRGGRICHPTIFFPKEHPVACYVTARRFRLRVGGNVLFHAKTRASPNWCLPRKNALPKWQHYENPTVALEDNIAAAWRTDQCGSRRRRKQARSRRGRGHAHCAHQYIYIFFHRRDEVVGG